MEESASAVIKSLPSSSSFALRFFAGGPIRQVGRGGGGGSRRGNVFTHRTRLVQHMMAERVLRISPCTGWSAMYFSPIRFLFGECLESSTDVPDTRGSNFQFAYILILRRVSYLITSASIASYLQCVSLLSLLFGRFLEILIFRYIEISEGWTSPFLPVSIFRDWHTSLPFSAFVLRAENEAFFRKRDASKKSLPPPPL